MGIEISGDSLDGLADRIEKQATDIMYERLAESVAEKAREAGLSSADSIDIDIDIETDTGTEIDVERVRRRANEILANR